MKHLVTLISSGIDKAGIESWDIFVHPLANASIRYNEQYGDVRALIREGGGAEGMVTLSKELVGIKPGVYRLEVVACTNGHIVSGLLALRVESRRDTLIKVLQYKSYFLTPAEKICSLSVELNVAEMVGVVLVFDFSSNRFVYDGYATNISIKSVQLEEPAGAV